MDQRSIFMDGVKSNDGRRRPDLNNRILESMRGIGGSHMPHTQLERRPDRSAFAGIHMEEDDDDDDTAPAAPAPAAPPAARPPRRPAAPPEAQKVHEYVYARCKQNWGWILLLLVGIIIVVLAAIRSMQCQPR